MEDQSLTATSATQINRPLSVRTSPNQQPYVAADQEKRITPSDTADDTLDAASIHVPVSLCDNRKANKDTLYNSDLEDVTDPERSSAIPPATTAAVLSSAPTDDTACLNHTDLSHRLKGSLDEERGLESQPASPHNDGEALANPYPRHRQPHHDENSSDGTSAGVTNITPDMVFLSSRSPGQEEERQLVGKASEKVTEYGSGPQQESENYTTKRGKDGGDDDAAEEEEEAVGVPKVDSEVKGERRLKPGRQLVSLWYVAVVVLTPVVLLPLPLVIDTPESRCAYVLFLMAVYWVTEAIPIAVTSLIPIFCLPMLGLLTARKTSSAYINDTSILFLGGLIVAIGIETWNLHRRIALSVMRIVGAEPRWLMLGMMLVTWFLSMWISNTATTAMMLPIVQAVMQQVSSPGEEDGVQEPQQEHNNVDKTAGRTNLSNGDTSAMELSDVPPFDANDGPDSRNSRRTTTTNSRPKAATTQKTGSRSQEGPRKSLSETGSRSQDGPRKSLSDTQLAKALSLSIAYAANVGGTASLTGTGPNLVLLGQSQIVFEEVGLTTPITFATWLVYGLPLSLGLVFLVWLCLQVVFLRCRGGCDCILRRKSGPEADARNSKVRDVIKAEYKKLGPITFAEGSVIVCFVLLVLLWITRDLGGAGGWGDLFQGGYVSDSTPAILVAVLMFVLPSRPPDIFRSSAQRRRDAGVCGQPLTALLTWQDVQQKMPWSIYLLLGGGFALARAAESSGLSVWLGRQLSVFGSLDPWLMLLLICYILTFVTEVTSNTAIATIMMPILAQLSLTLQLNPLFFMFPAALTTSFAFMLPVATPPNAIVFAFGSVRVVDMMKCGFLLNLLSVPCLILATVTWGNAFFHFDVLPPEFSPNVTALSNVTAV